MKSFYIPRMRQMFFSLILFSVTTGSRAQVILNELMQSNVDCIMDDLNEFPDSWVELYNTGTAAINLNQYSIGLSDNPGEAWKLPQLSIAAKGRQLIYCDKESTGRHTSFRLESGKGGSVYLFRNGQVVDKVENLAKQPAPNIAYGRLTDGDERWGYMAVPTPGQANCGTICENVLGDPVFSEHGRVLTGAGKTLTLELSLPEDSPEGTQIRYTLDGSEPTATSPLYTEPFVLKNTSVIRAKLFCTGWLSPRSTTQSYIFFPRRMTLPVVSITMNDEYLNDPKIGFYVEGNYNSQKKNYEYDWRRPANIEMFVDEGESSVINQLGETRTMGGISRTWERKSLVFYANKRFGKKRLKYEFFPDQKPGLDTYKSIILRNAGNDFNSLFLRDAIIQRTMATYTDIDWQAWRPTVVYINGEYTGMLNIRERSNEDNIFTNYDGLEDIDLIADWTELKEGTMENWEAFQAFYNEHGHTWDEYEEWMDCTEFLNIMLMNLYFNNQDFPGHNIIFWRPRAEGGRWRVVAKDTDFGMGLYVHSASYNSIAWINTPDYDPDYYKWSREEHTRLFRRLMEDETFQREFLDRAAIYMGDFLNFDGIWAVWEPMYNMIKTELSYHLQALRKTSVNYPWSLNRAKQWVADRTPVFYTHLADFYGLGTPTPLTVNQKLSKNERGDIDIEMNGVRLSKSLFNGKFFANRTLTIHALPHEEKNVAGWDVVQTNADGTVESRFVKGDTYTFSMPQCQSLAINVRFGIFGDVNGDGNVDISDVTTLVNIILGNAERTAFADVDCDGEVNISDVTSLVNIILGK
ncbi:MAG: CotH kinase family protein [Bacteroidaceae bacterium]|nr:CotH kinase family protein [Bacteroidaceae bacterium]